MIQGNAVLGAWRAFHEGGRMQCDTALTTIQGNAVSGAWRAFCERGRMQCDTALTTIQGNAVLGASRAFHEGGRMQCVPTLAFGEGRPSPIVPRPSKTGSPALLAAPACPLASVQASVDQVLLRSFFAL